MKQYVVTVNDAKGFPKFELFENPTPLDIISNTAIAAGPSIDIQLSDPDEVHTFTISVSQP